MSPRSTVALDSTDWALLAELQRDARLSFTELSRRVRLSPSAVTERVRRLEQEGVVRGYRAEIDLAGVGLPVEAVVRLMIPGARYDRVDRLLPEIPEVLDCRRVAGDECYVMTVVARDLGHLEQVVSRLADTGTTTTNIVFSHPLPRRPVDGPVSLTSEAEADRSPTVRNHGG